MMDAMVSGDLVADRLLLAMHDAGKSIDNLKLQKLLYYVQGVHLSMTGEPLFDDDFEAWVHGPVIPSLYRRFKQYSWHAIGLEGVADKAAARRWTDTDATDAIDYVVEQLGDLDGTALERKTHDEPPWLIARGDLADDEPSRAIISKSEILDFFNTLAA